MKIFTPLLPSVKKLFTAALILATTALNAQQLITDSLFGTNGEVFSISTGAQNGYTTNLLKQPDGKLIICGYTHGGANEFWNNMFRVDACGKVDSTFGTNGMVMHKFDQRNLGYSYLLKDDGKIMVVGTQASSNAASQAFPFIARYNADGTPDTTFATMGSNKITSPGSDRFSAIFKANDSKWLCTDFNLLMRFDSLGVVDSTFGINGIATFPAPYSSYGSSGVMRSDNKIVYASRQNFGGGHQNIYICFDTLGVVDSTFGNNGLVIEGLYYTVDAPRIFLQSTDKLITVSNNSVVSEVIAARYNTNGTLDTTFGTNGYLIISAPSGPAPLKYLSALDGDNFLIGYQQNGIPSQFLKVTADGIIDSTFLLNGSIYYQFNNNASEKAEVGLHESNGDLFMAACSHQGPRMAVSKFTPTSAVPHITQNFTTLNSNVSALGASFQWYLNGIAINGATDSTYILNQNGTYSVQVTTSNGCISALDSITVINAGITTINGLAGISFFPNPVQNDLTIFNTSGKQLTIRLFDITGKLVSEQKTSSNNYTYSMSDLGKGVYIIEMIEANSVSINKIIKQ